MIFLTRYAAETIQKVTGRLQRVAVIPHGVGAAFRQSGNLARWAAEPGKIVTCLYVSNAAMYKHQWTVVRAMGALRKRGYFVRLVLAGGGSGPAKKLLDEAIASIDPAGDFVECVGFVPHDSLPALLKAADLFIFASSCENMPNTLVEGMASGLPIACSDRGPMPEVLADGGVFFNPEDAASIASAVESIIDNEELRASIAKRAHALSEQYSWSRCAGETWDFLRHTLHVCGKHRVSP